MKTKNQKYKFTQLVILLILVSTISFLAKEINSYYEWPPKQYSNVEVFNLTKKKVPWWVFYGSKDTSCGLENCHLLGKFEAAKFQKTMVLPAREFPLKEYKKGQLIFLRTSVDIPEPLLKSSETIYFHSTYIFAKHYRFYINGSLIETGDSELMNIRIPKEKKTIDIGIEIDPGNLPYQGLAHRGDIVIGPKNILKDTVFIAKDIQRNSQLWFLLPKLTLCVMFIFFFFAIAKTDYLINFIFYSFLSCLVIFLRSDIYQSYLFSLQNAEFLGMVVRNFSYVFLGLFFFDFFFKTKKPKILIIGYMFISLLSTLSLVGLHYSQIYRLAYNFTDSFYIILKIAALLIAFFGARSAIINSVYQSGSFKTVINRLLYYFIVLYLVINFIECGFLIGDFFGLNANSPVVLSKSLDLIFFFIIGAFTAIDLGYEINAKQLIQAELQAVNERLELGRTVQNLLLPKNLHGQTPSGHYTYFYYPAAKMSGDWITTKEFDTCHTYFIGDVVGKGPSAAIAVASIISFIKNFSTSLGTDVLIENLHKHLQQLFGGAINTTLAAVEISKDSSENYVIYSSGFGSWVHIVEDVPKVLSFRSKTLGQTGTCQFDSKVVLSQGTFFAFTDGILEGSRSMKKLIHTIKGDPKSFTSEASLYDLLVEVGKSNVHDDDKTALFLKTS